MRAVQIVDLTGPQTALRVVDTADPEPSHLLTPGSGVVVDRTPGAAFRPDAAATMAD